uniref:GATA-type domain-containing protein n=2 Tax=Rhabditophanes sp. KR3021 TaxID=114890 RepID=A0AC35TN84_9BILA
METFRPQINVSVQNYINNKSEDGQPQQNVPPSQRMILNNAEQIERYNQTQVDRQVLENPLTPPAEMRITRKCSRCGTTETKQWRKSGKEYLCNCCSQYQKRTGRPRPLNLSKKGSLTRIRKPARIQTVGSRIN